ncbi:TPA: Tn3 family transposase [Klebsiella pneumoniae subsp. pneumoniae]|nr:Tn3 family transposase [Salmonella enterica]HDU5631223.1 Tn3 family transposase [Klebsiella pneumoniae subsp. pneumoniae]
MIRHYTFNETDLSVIRQRRGAANRLGFAVQLCYLRFPGIFLGVDDPPFLPLLRMVAAQLKVPVESWNHYGQREQTRREHLVELQTVFGFKPFTMSHYRQAVHTLTELALQTDKGIVLASPLVENLRRQSIILPAMNAIERASAEAITRANRSIHAALADSLIPVHRQRLDELLKRKDGSKMTWLAWLRQSPAKPNSRHMLEHIERLKAWQALDLPAGIERQVHQNRLLKIAREGGQMTPADLVKFESQRRYATLVALAIEGMATVTDEIIDLHDRIIGKLFNAAKNKHQQQFQASGKAINDKVRMYGRIERTLFILDWLQSVELRRRVHAGLNKGEARNALARAVFFYRLGEIRDRSFEQQRYRASGLNLVTAAIVLWNTVYLERATSALRAHGKALDDTLLQYLSPLGWEHINLTGDYLWRSSAKVGAGKFRPLRPLPPA